MKPSDLDNLLNSQEFHNAPPGLTESIMKAVREIELEGPARKKPVQYSGWQTGLRLIAAGLAALLLNFSPLANSLMDRRNTNSRRDYAPSRLEYISEVIDYYTVKVSSTLTEPFEAISKAFIKED